MTGADSWIYKESSWSRRKRFRQIRSHRRQRVQRGWSVFDFWSADTYILGVIAQISDQFREHGVGYPGGGTEAEWADTLTRISVPLHAWADGKFEWATREESIQGHAAAREALHLFADNFAHFWD